MLLSDYMDPTERNRPQGLKSTMALTTYFWNDPIFSLSDFPTLLDEFRDAAAPGQRRMSRGEGVMAPRPR